MGASMVRWTIKLLHYAKVLVKVYKVIPKCFLSWVFFTMNSIVVVSIQINGVKMMLPKKSTKKNPENKCLNYLFNFSYFYSIQKYTQIF
jgi:hypothetical protein